MGNCSSIEMSESSGALYSGRSGMSSSSTSYSVNKIWSEFSEDRVNDLLEPRLLSENFFCYNVV